MILANRLFNFIMLLRCNSTSCQTNERHFVYIRPHFQIHILFYQQPPSWLPSKTDKKKLWFTCILLRPYVECFQWNEYCIWCSVPLFSHSGYHIPWCSICLKLMRHQTRFEQKWIWNLCCVYIYLPPYLLTLVLIVLKGKFLPVRTNNRDLYRMRVWSDVTLRVSILQIYYTACP